MKNPPEIPEEADSVVLDNPGFAPTATFNSDFVGKANFVQLVRREVFADMPPFFQRTRGKYWLDNRNPYNEQDSEIRAIAPPASWPASMQDEPQFPFNQVVTLSDRFRTFVMFKPAAGGETGNIFVTLAVIDWGWDAVAYRDIPYPTEFQAYVPDPQWQPSEEFPEWEETLLNLVPYP